ncbi:hypothetical protein QJS83_16625 [Bdellovibrio sp. 22V]|uniref:hypothetical protein n=1 Tax=Bdellovibrio sp. 22V TaxID=3044166 RepID=UPI002542A954|nr:hypothetical protein [Bdellovibrio sp. 22V]WII72088.1 hypothetical protein QJS83_16625 [Bdellovibrio sp. 22V]
MKNFFSLLFISLMVFGLQVRADGTHSFEKIMSTLIDFELMPTQPGPSDHVTIYIRPNTTFQTPGMTDIILQAKLDGNDFSLVRPLNDVWIFASLPFEVAGNHILEVSYYLEDKPQADALRAAIGVLDTEISKLQTDLLLEEDDDMKVVIQTAIDDKTAERIAAVTTLENLKTFVGSETFTFSVASN